MLTAVFFTVNQARLVAAAASMQVWGFRTGYERHVFLCTGSAISGRWSGFYSLYGLGARQTGSRIEEPGERLV